MGPKDRLTAVLVAVIWGVNFVAIELGMVEVPPLLFVAIRFAAVAFPAVLFVPRPSGNWRAVAAIGVFTSLGQFALLYTAMHLGMPAGIASLVLQAQVIFTVLLASLVLRERASVRQWVGVGIGALGLAIVGFGRAEHTPGIAVVITLAAALSWGIGNVVTRAARIHAGLSVVVWSALVVPVPTLVLSLLLDGPDEIGRALAGLSLAAVASTAFTVLASTLFAYTVWYGLLARHAAAEVAPYILLVPPVGIVAAAVVLGEQPTAAEWLGAVVVLAGVAVATLSRTRTTSSAPASAPAGSDAEHVDG